MESAAFVAHEVANPRLPTAAPYAQAPAVPRSVFHVIRRNGAVTVFDPSKIEVALTKAFLAVEGGTAAASRRVHETVAELAAQVEAAVTRRLSAGGACHIEDIQDQVELALMRAGEHKVARAYIIYRDTRAQERAARPGSVWTHLVHLVPVFRSLHTARGRLRVQHVDRVQVLLVRNHGQGVHRSDMQRMDHRFPGQPVGAVEDGLAHQTVEVTAHQLSPQAGGVAIIERCLP